MNFADEFNRHFSFGSHLSTRDVKAVAKSTSGLLKILYPHREWTQDELVECLELAMEGRRRVKEQLKRMGSFEYYQTSFSYIHNETREEHFVGVSEQGGDQTISSDPLAPGAVYVAQVGDGERVQLGRLEIARSPGTGKMRLAGSHSKSTRDSVSAAFEYLRNRASELAIDHIIGSEDYQVQIVPLLPGDSPPDLGMATILAMFSLEG